MAVAVGALLVPLSAWFLAVNGTVTEPYLVRRRHPRGLLPGPLSVADFLAAYITLPIFLALYLGHKVWTTVLQGAQAREESGWQGGFWDFGHRVGDIDVRTGKKEMDELEARDVPPVPRNWMERFWFWLA
ncbi:hypothetical protein LTR53_014686 [Teratosphaeriaceae sp. CCFEE 6253]|nr:hypothetical protein LTR53_014686 [Teratosphaeriaceae sp. CCFEE 6253]